MKTCRDTIIIVTLVLVLLSGCMPETIQRRDLIPEETYSVEYVKNGEASSRQETNTFSTFRQYQPFALMESEYQRAERGSVQTFFVINEKGIREFVGFTRQTSMGSSFVEASATTTCFRRDLTTMEAICGVVVRIEDTPNLRTAIEKYNHGEYPLLYDTYLYYKLPPQEFTSISGLLDFAPDYTESVLTSVHFNEGYEMPWFANTINWGRSAVLRITDPTQSVIAQFSAASEWWKRWDATASQQGNITDVREAIRTYITLLHDNWDTAPYDGEQVVMTWGDANRYLTAQRLLNRENPFVVRFFPHTEQERTFIIEPHYDFQSWGFNDAVKQMSSAYHLIFDKQCEVNHQFNVSESMCRDIETSGWANTKAPSLQSIEITEVLPEQSRVKFFMPIRATQGNLYTLLFPLNERTRWDTYYATQRQEFLDQGETFPVYYERFVKEDDKYRNITASEAQTWQTAAEEMNVLQYWTQRNRLPLTIAFRVQDNSKYVPVPCGDSFCGYKAITYDIEGHYVFTFEDIASVQWTWAALSTLPGVIGNRSLGLGYAYKPGSGTGLVPAMSQMLMVSHYRGEVVLPDEYIYFLCSRSAVMGNMPETSLQWLDLMDARR